MKIATGIIVLAQETRFRLIDDQGRSRLFLLSHKAGLEPQDLPIIQREQIRVSVAYGDAPDMAAQLAHAIYDANQVLGDRQ